MIIDYSFRNTGGAGVSGLKHAVHRLPKIFLKKPHSIKKSNITIQIHRLNVCM